MKVHLSTLGCKLNESELESWARRFAEEGHQVVEKPGDADLIVLNTCTVTHVAARKSRQVARQLARISPAARLILTGCYASLSPEESKALPNVALVVPNSDKDQLVAKVAGLRDDARFQTTETGCRLPEAVSGTLDSSDWLDADVETQVAGREPTPPMEGVRSNSSMMDTATLPHLRTRSFVKIQDGCNMSCSYCIIPLARGSERSRPVREIVEQVQALVAAGFQEIILTGVQISAYRYDDLGSQRTLRDLVAAILAETGVPRLRLTSIAPWDLDGSLLDLWQDPRLCRHLHLSLQSGSDTVLRRMRRPYTTLKFESALEMARARISGAGITTDVIVGFPGESDLEFEQSLELVDRIKFSRVHVFPYSARARTVAAGLPLQVTDRIKESRVKQMQAVADANQRAFAARFVGQEMSVLWESGEPLAGDDAQLLIPDGLHREGEHPARMLKWCGYTDNYIRVVVASEFDLRNRIMPARLTRITEDGVAAMLSAKEF